jgi:hypothetical protein
MQARRSIQGSPAYDRNRVNRSYVADSLSGRANTCLTELRYHLAWTQELKSIVGVNSQLESKP